jgi:hypothetical protein
MNHLFEVLKSLKDQNKKVLYYIDMEGEFTIYTEDNETLYTGTIYSFIEEAMSEYNVQNDSIITA